jgi:hypothetical protein
MASENNFNEEKKKKDKDVPKSKQLIKMLSFRVVMAYYKEIERVADLKNMTTSKLIRSYIKEGMKKDLQLTKRDEEQFRVD